MKILILSRGIPNAHDSQEGCFEFDQAKALKAAGHDVVIMAVDSRIRKYWRKLGIDKKDIDGIKTYKLFLFPTSIIRRLLSFRAGVKIEYQEIKCLYRYITKKEGDFDIVHAHFLTSIFYAAKLKKDFNITLIGTEHWSKVNTDVPSKQVLYMGRIAYPTADCIVSVSDSLRKRISEIFDIESEVIHNLIDTSYLQPLPEGHNDKAREFTIVLVGSLIKRKGFDFFLKAYAKSSLASEHQTRIKIIGGGTELGNLRELASTLNISDKVDFLGQQNKQIIFDILNKADLFVLPSRSENFSVSVLEALANGLPVIATLCGGIRECIDSSNGLLVEVDNETEMVDALERMYDTIHEYDRKKIRNMALAEYSPANIANKLLSIYKHALINKKIDY